MSLQAAQQCHCERPNNVTAGRSTMSLQATQQCHCKPLNNVIASRLAAKQSRQVGAVSDRDCRVAMLLAMTMGELSQ
jgi:hypothetical protein